MIEDAPVSLDKSIGEDLVKRVKEGLKEIAAKRARYAESEERWRNNEVLPVLDITGTITTSPEFTITQRTPTVVFSVGEPVQHEGEEIVINHRVIASGDVAQHMFSSLLQSGDNVILSGQYTRVPIKGFSDHRVPQINARKIAPVQKSQ